VALDDLLVFLPVLGAPLLHAPVLRYDLLSGLKRPLDGGGGALGRNKTWRGALVMTTGVVAATLLLSLWDGWWSELPRGLRDAGPVVLGLLLGAGTVLGELPNSFLKRRLGIAPGGRGLGATGAAFAVWDQADFVPVIVLLLLPLWAMPPGSVLLAFAVVTAIHLVLNVVGYAIGARTSPI
jgi:hypothetical protein